MIPSEVQRLDEVNKTAEHCNIIVEPVIKFIIYKLAKSAKRAGKMDKIPLSPKTGKTININDRKHWVSESEAMSATKAFSADGVGFIITQGYWFLDIDNCIENNEWSLLAKDLVAQFLGAYFEISSSGKGLHLIGRGHCPEHTCRNPKVKIELYTTGRFAALTGTDAQGSREFDASALLPALVEKYFKKTSSKPEIDERPNQLLPISDDVLIDKMLSAKNNQDSSRASFKALWAANAEILTKYYPDPNRPCGYDESRADAALAQHLAFWTGNDAERMVRLMYRSALVRQKWYDRADYIPRTVDSARANQTVFYQGSTSERSQDGEVALDSDSFTEVSIADIFTNHPSPPHFIIESILPSGVLTLCGGHGGSGKSLLALQAAVCIATGHPFMGKTVKQGHVIFYSAEDAADIIRHRLYRLCQHMNIDPRALSDSLKILDATNAPVLYHEISNGGVRQGSATPTYERLNAYARQFSPQTIIIDNASDTFDANENERMRVRGFIRALIQLGKPHNAAILLVAHVDKQTARSSGSTEGYSGSTAWHNSARSRLFLTVKDEILVLEHQKSNWGKCAEPIQLCWGKNGILEHIAAMGSEDTYKLIISLIAKYYERGDFISPSQNSRNNPFKILHSDPRFPPSLTRDKLTTLMKGMEDAGELIREAYSTENRKRRKRYKVAPSAPS